MTLAEDQVLTAVYYATDKVFPSSAVSSADVASFEKIAKKIATSPDVKKSNDDDNKKVNSIAVSTNRISHCLSRLKKNSATTSSRFVAHAILDNEL